MDSDSDLEVSYHPEILPENVSPILVDSKSVTSWSDLYSQETLAGRPGLPDDADISPTNGK
jgi:hypothetical protein